MVSFEGIINSIEANIPAHTAGDYVGEDGLWHCGKCHEAKELRLKIDEATAAQFGIKQVVRRNCACRRAAIEAEDKKIEEAKRIQRIRQIREASLSSPMYRESRFEKDDGKDAKSRAISMRYVEKWAEMKAENIGLLFTGGVGTGKTFYAACIANALVDKDVSVWMTTMPQIIHEMSEDYGESRDYVLNRIRNVNLLVIDDFGIERNTEYTSEKVYEIINERYKSNKPLILTTNIPFSDIQTQQGIKEQRIYDRILEMCPVNVTPAIRRRAEISKSKLDAIKRLKE